MSLFKQTSHVSITVTDVEKAREFYTGLLGLSEIPRTAAGARRREMPA